MCSVLTVVHHAVVQTGGSKGYAYIQFAHQVTADVVASTMNNYLMFNRLLRCKFSFYVPVMITSVIVFFRVGRWWMGNESRVDEFPSLCTMKAMRLVVDLFYGYVVMPPLDVMVAHREVVRSCHGCMWHREECGTVQYGDSNDDDDGNKS